MQRLPCAVIAVQRGSEFLSLFVTVSFLKVRVRARARKGAADRSHSTFPVPMMPSFIAALPFYSIYVADRVEARSFEIEGSVIIDKMLAINRTAN